jgi:general secretion pathway protein B
MSLILDALRRSERTRQRTLEGRLGSAAAEPTPPRVQVPWAALIGVVLFVNAGALAALYWGGSFSAPSPSPAAPVHRSPAPSAKVSKLAPVIRHRGPLRSLAEEAGSDRFRAIPSLQSSAVVSEPQPETAAPEKQIRAAAAQSQTLPSSAGASQGKATPIDALPDAFRQSLPKLYLDVHVYNDNPKDRFVLINMHRYQRGDILPAGPRVVRITRDGVVLSYHGRQFLLPRQ